MYDHVLVPTDGSDNALTALEHGLSVARQFDATLHTLHVVQTTGATDKLDCEEFEAALDRISRAGEEAVETVVEHAHRSGLAHVESAVVRGVPEAEIVQYVEQEDVDIVVMATAGRTGSAREVLGSVAEGVARSSPVPVLTVNVGVA